MDSLIKLSIRRKIRKRIENIGLRFDEDTIQGYILANLFKKELENKVETLSGLRDYDIFTEGA